MANLANPHKRFNFAIQALGLNPFLAQQVTLPDIDIEPVEHGEGNRDIKTAGKIKVGMLRVEKLSNADNRDSWVWDWVRQVQNIILGTSSVPQLYKRNLQVLKYGTDGITIINRWDLLGCWPSKINGIELSQTTSENTMESLEFCVDLYDYQ